MATATTEPWEQVAALDDGRAFVDRSSDRMLQVRGADARRWLERPRHRRRRVAPDGVGRVRSLLLTPTGRIRADIVDRAHRRRGVPRRCRTATSRSPSTTLLGPYVLSSAVVRDATDATGAAVAATSVPRATGGSGHSSPRDAADRRDRLADGGLLTAVPARPEAGASAAAIPRMGATSTPGPSRPRSGLERLDRPHEGVLPRTGVRGEGPRTSVIHRTCSATCDGTARRRRRATRSRPRGERASVTSPAPHRPSREGPSRSPGWGGRHATPSSSVRTGFGSPLSPTGLARSSHFRSRRPGVRGLPAFDPFHSRTVPLL